MDREAITGPIENFEGSYNFLSNFFPAHVEYESAVYPTVEHAFQAAKTLDQEERRRIWEARGPGEAKRLGRKATLRPDWEQVKVAIMAGLLRQKFHWMRYGVLLRATGDRPLIEGNWWHDQIWGDCRCSREACALPGQNRLGVLLMEIRKELADASL